MKKVMLFFAVAVMALAVNAQGEKKETKAAPAKKEAAPAKKDDKKDAKAAPAGKKEEKKDAKTPAAK